MNDCVEEMRKICDPTDEERSLKTQELVALCQLLKLDPFPSHRHRNRALWRRNTLVEELFG